MTLPREHTTHRGWIQSPLYDLALFTLAPLSGLIVVAAARYIPGGYRLSIAAVFLVAIPHYMSSFSFYLGDDNLSYYKTRRLAFFAGPVIIFTSVLLLRLFGYQVAVLSAMFVWNVWHVALQSAGILSIYRRLNAGPSDERGVAKLAILAVNATMAFWYADRYEPLYDLLVTVHPLAPWTLRTVALPAAAGSLAVLFYRIAQRERPLSLAEGGFLATSLLLFHPFLWARDANEATFAMLMGHFIQYLAIVWLLNHRKYAGVTGTRHQRLLAWVSRSPGTVLLGILIIGIAFFTADQITQALGIGMVYIILWNAMTLVHFYVDGLVWAFRQPHVRQTVGPFLIPGERLMPAGGRTE